MTYRIQWQRLLEEEKDFLDSLGIESGETFARFTRDLTWEEITVAFAHFVSLRKRTSNPEENHVNFAIGDCLIEMERLRGKERTEQFAREFLRLSAFRDYVVGLAGSALIYLQQVEEVIKGYCACLSFRGLRLTPEDFLSSDPGRRRATLGQMKSALLSTERFSSDFEREFHEFVHDRNRFIHSLWVENYREHLYTGLPREEDVARLADFINALVRRAYRVERIFKGGWVAIDEARAKELPSISPWLRYIREFRSVLRNAP